MLVAVVAVAMLIAVAVAVGRPGGDSDDGARPEARPVEPDDDFVIDQHDGPYRIVYLLEDPRGEIASETDRLWVRPPFESRLETATGAPPGGETVSVQIGSLERLRIGGVAEELTIARVPALAPGTIRIEPVVDAAVAAGLLERVEQRVVAGRRCQVFRSGSTLGAGPLTPISPAEHTESCIDGDGLLLEETLFTDGEAILRRVAVEVDLEPDLDAETETGTDLFDPGPISAPVDQGGGATTPADPASAPVGPFHELPDDAVPDGFELVGRYSVIPPQPDKFADETQRPSIIAGVADVHADDAGDLFVVYQGATLGGVEAFAPIPFAGRVDSPTLGTGELLLSALGTELRFALDGGRFVHVFGTLDPAVLAEVADALVETTGTGLVLLEE